MFKQNDHVELTRDLKGGVEIGIKAGCDYKKGSKGLIVQIFGDMAMVEFYEPKYQVRMTNVRLADLKLVEVKFF